MAHEIDFRDNRWCFAFKGERSAIWHGLGQQARDDWGRDAWSKQAGLDFEVASVPLAGIQAEHDNIDIDTHKLLIRTDTREPLSVVTSQWQTSQNSNAFDFAQPFVDAGFAEYNTAGSLFGGRRCFILLKTKEGFSLPGSDDTEGFILVQISHEYGICDLTLPTSVRVVCNNTRAFALQQASKEALQAARIVHIGARHFDPDRATAYIEAYRAGIAKYAEEARFLASKQVGGSDRYTEFVRRVYQLGPDGTNGTGRDGISEHGLKIRQAHNKAKIDALKEAVLKQPGATLSEGSWWSAFNAITWHEDHAKHDGKDAPVIANRIYGKTAEVKERALKVALELAR